VVAMASDDGRPSTMASDGGGDSSGYDSRGGKRWKQ